MTLIELACVCALLMIILACGSAGYRIFNALPVRTEIDMIAMICQSRIARAHLTAVPQELDFDAYTCASGVCFGAPYGAKGPPSHPDRDITAGISFPRHTFHVTASGVVSPGSLYLTDTTRSCGYALTVSVDPFPYIRRYRYTEGRWLAYT